jgi:probable rRNA maturation factor
LIVIEPTDPAPHPAPSIRRTELTRFLTRAQRAVGLRGEVTILLADDKRLKELNRSFRGKNKATDVLSFPAYHDQQNPTATEDIAGDLAISIDTAARQAAEFNHTLEDELRILILHGLLHLAGYDHEADSGEMAAQETTLRTRLKLPHSLIERAAAPATKRSVIKKSATKKPLKRIAVKKKAATSKPRKSIAKKATRR